MHDLREMFQHVKLEILTGQYTVITHHWDSTNVLRDPFARLYLLTEGKGSINFRGQQRALQPGVLYLLPSGETLQHYPSPGVKFFWLHFSAVTPLKINLFDIVRCPFDYSPEHLETYKSYFRRMITLFQSEQPGAVLEQQGLLRLLLAPFFEEEQIVWKKNVGQIARFEQTFVYIDQHLNHPITTAELADTLHVHPTYFANLFSKLFGISPQKYISRKRVEKAQSLLWQTEWSVKQIAYHLGYEDPCYFSRVFRQITGMAPVHYREERQTLLQGSASLS